MKRSYIETSSDKAPRHSTEWITESRITHVKQKSWLDRSYKISRWKKGKGVVQFFRVFRS